MRKHPYWFPALAAVVALATLTGCPPRSEKAPGGATVKPAPLAYADQGRPDAGWNKQEESRDLGQVMVRQDAPVRDFLADMERKFNCRIEVSKSAGKLITDADPRISLGAGNAQDSEAFAICRAALEARGFVLQSKGNVLGRPAFLLDASAVKELSQP